MIHLDIQDRKAPASIPAEIATEMRRELLIMTASAALDDIFVVHRAIVDASFSGNIVLIGTRSEEAWTINGYMEVRPAERPFVEAQVRRAAKAVERTILSKFGERFEAGGQS